MSEVVVLSKDDLRELVTNSLTEALRKTQPRDLANEAPASDPNQLLTKREAAALLSCSTSTVDGHARGGRLTRHYISKKAVRFKRVEVMQLVKAKRSK